MDFATSLEQSKRWLMWDATLRLDRIEIALAQLVEKVDAIMAGNAELLAQVTRITELKPAIIAYVNGQNTKLDALQASLDQLLADDAAGKAQVAAAVAELKGDADDISAAITSGTPAAPPA